MLAMEVAGAIEYGRSLWRQMQRMGPAILLRGLAYDEALSIQMIDHCYKVGSLDAERSADLGLVQAGIFTDHEQHGEIGRTQADLFKGLDHVVEDAELGAPQRIAYKATDSVKIRAAGRLHQSAFLIINHQ